MSLLRISMLGMYTYVDMPWCTYISRPFCLPTNSYIPTLIYTCLYFIFSLVVANYIEWMTDDTHFCFYQEKWPVTLHYFTNSKTKKIFLFSPLNFIFPSFMFLVILDNCILLYTIEVISWCSNFSRVMLVCLKGSYSNFYFSLSEFIVKFILAALDLKICWPPVSYFLKKPHPVWLWWCKVTLLLHVCLIFGFAHNLLKDHNLGC